MFLAIGVLLCQVQAVTPKTSHAEAGTLKNVQVARAVSPESSATSPAAARPLGVEPSAVARQDTNDSELLEHLSTLRSRLDRVELLDFDDTAARLAPAQPGELPSEAEPFTPGSSSATLPGGLPSASSPLAVARVSPFMVAGQNPAAKKTWYALVAASHGAATFDAWSTRRVITTGAGHELNPLLRPFASSNALYAAVQVGPGLLDILGKRMMSSQRGWVRKIWWLPQAASAAGSVISGVHNLGVARRAAPGSAQ